MESINKIEKKDWKTFRIEQSGNKKRSIKIYEQIIFLKGYNKKNKTSVYYWKWKDKTRHYHYQRL